MWSMLTKANMYDAFKYNLIVLYIMNAFPNIEPVEGGEKEQIQIIPIS